MGEEGEGKGGKDLVKIPLKGGGRVVWAVVAVAGGGVWVAAWWRGGGGGAARAGNSVVGQPGRLELEPPEFDRAV